MPQADRPAVCQIVGYKNSGKTTLLCALIPLLQERGCKVAVIKHDAHHFEMDHAGSDTWKHRQAGASAIAITSPGRTARIEEQGSSLAELIAAFASYDYILVEGFKNEFFPKLVLIHEEADVQLLQQLENITAVCVWEPLLSEPHLEGLQNSALFPIHDIQGIANHLWRQRSYFQNFNI
ncbi:molybdopterin-guanine dinucleotide biosynthesis protein B [Paenibacillus albidus]|uniref:molybdopterin-guanine dinucleotide biosynthesis protein B n=1 Tax=Paenibacillus albidus TaxID=2041023 RepID=UPI0016681A29|nr:molybdopterin-guanine dinucleotide biosynthesis protein B [Paenibacillus albidus]